MSRLHIVHRTTFDYDRSVSASYNEARMRPADLAHQSVLYSRITASPATHQASYVDYWGTTVTGFEVLTSHEGLTVVAQSRVDVGIASPGELVGWEVVGDERTADQMCEFLVPTPVTEPSADLTELARDHVGERSPAEAAATILNAVRDQVEYVPGATGVHTRAMEAWQERKGVCQDIAHLGAAALRSVGIPTRYVSGYLHPLAADAEPGVRVNGQSHAWVEYWVGHWVGYDPTNQIPVNTHHVIVARGREYGDVAPIRGVYSGGGRSDQQVDVQITREE
ncbi:MAG: transglutaminase domain-containing protein [Beutenbergiaceae bacterium]